MEKNTYAAAGVDINVAEAFVHRLQKMARRPNHDKLWKAAGGYACIWPMSSDVGVAVTTDGIGTKLLVAHELGIYDTIGIDLVAMVANDLICVGAEPNLFLDYFAVGKLKPDVADQLMKGIVEGCDRAGMILAGGETAEMPGLYQDGHYDFAGFALGTVTRAKLLSGDNIKPGQYVVGVASSGIHSNGLSLARKVLSGNKQAYERLLVPTNIYVKPVVELLSNPAHGITGLVHVTGSGWRNLFRLNAAVGFEIDAPLPVPSVFEEIGRTVEQDEMYRTFNMGMGLAVIADSNHSAIIETFQKHGYEARVVGSVTDEAETLHLRGANLTLRG